jgi:dephospho-CoA kinase
MDTPKSQATSHAAALAVSGQTASGKSTLVRAIKLAPASAVVSFGRYVQHVAEEIGLPQDRRSLQDLGQSLIDRDGAAVFLNKVLESSGYDAAHTRLCIFDGVRHVSIWTAITEAFSYSALVSVVCSVNERQRRLIERDSLSSEQARLILSHPMDNDVELLSELATVLIRSDHLGPDELAMLGRMIGEIFAGPEAS